MPKKAANMSSAVASAPKANAIEPEGLERRAADVEGFVIEPHIGIRGG
jgi:hypothetical protein